MKYYASLITLINIIPLTVSATTEQPEIITVLGQALPNQQIYTAAEQHLDEQQIARSLDSNLGRLLADQFTSITINDAQNNPFQMDLQYRGFTLSPLLGMPQGMSVYMNGVRFNEPFGDTINWDLIPLAALSQVSLYSGSNPLFGQNTLGGSLVLTTKDGFSFEGVNLDLRAGSHDMYQGTIEAGGNNGEFAAYTLINRYQEQGWRRFSPSTVNQFLTQLSWQLNTDNLLALTAATSHSELIGNGAVPYDLMALEGRDAVYTHPDSNHNRYQFFSLNGQHQLNQQINLNSNIFYRYSKNNSLNGDDSDFEECAIAGIETLCDEDEQAVTFIDHQGQLVSDDLDDLGLDADELDGLNNLSHTKQHSTGVSAEISIKHKIANLASDTVIGAGAQRASIDFSSDSEFAQLNNGTMSAIRDTSAVGLFDQDSIVRLDTKTRHYYGFVANSLQLNQALRLNSAIRYQYDNIMMTDLAPGDDGTTLDGDHSFNNINPTVSLDWQINSQFNSYLSYGRASRTPTPVELSCADEDAPCKLPNGFVSDPPLEQVTTHTLETGLQYQQNQTLLAASLFYARNRDDIIFQQAGGLPSEGYFANIGDTLRKGLELSLKQEWQQWYWGVSYSYLDATFDSSFISFSPNHPLGANRQVTPGDRIPGLAKHSAKAHIEWQSQQWTIGANLHYQSDQYYRGDEANDAEPLAGYTVINLSGRYQLTDNVALYAKINNLFDRDYQTFGTYGESDEVLGEIYPDFDDARFVGPAQPRSYIVGVKISFD
ncbi:TonB-dependent receptor [Shewanella marina]|uniref:TonB-dependent receptor n=1 Tax=Shewanella marina TaxID=487319 RepID=UPI0004704F66|nr:TonB-dependent receptor [Shewanella marina]